MLGTILFGVFGLACLVGIAWAFSNNRGAVDWRLVATGISLQVAFAALVLLAPGGRQVFEALGHGFVKLLEFTQVGAALVFGDLSNAERMGKAVVAGQQLADAQVVNVDPATGVGAVTAKGWDPQAWKAFGFVFAFQVLPTIIFFAALMGVLYHAGVMQQIVRGMAWAITKLMRVSGAETTSVCASIFIGQTEAPLTIRPYIAKMTPSELLTIMVGGMAHIAGGVLAAYVGMLGGGDPEQQAFYAKHLLTASIMAAPATLVISKILAPETGEPLTRGTVRMDVEKSTVNVIDAAAGGASDGLRLALNVGAMLLAFVALIALLNAPLTWLGEASGLAAWLGRPTDLGTLLGYVMAPVAWIIGVPWQDAVQVGGLIGQKIVLNEFIAYLQLAEIKDTLTDQGRLVATYALCGFANFSSIAIQLGGIGGLAPERRSDIARLGMRAVLGGSIATFMTATIAGVLTRFG